MVGDWHKEIKSSCTWIATIWDANIAACAAILWKTISRIQCGVQIQYL